MLEGFVPYPDSFVKRYKEKGYWVDKTLGEEFDEVSSKSHCGVQHRKSGLKNNTGKSSGVAINLGNLEFSHLIAYNHKSKPRCFYFSPCQETVFLDFR